MITRTIAIVLFTLNVSRAESAGLIKYLFCRILCIQPLTNQYQYTVQELTCAVRSIWIASDDVHFSYEGAINCEISCFFVVGGNVCDR